MALRNTRLDNLKPYVMLSSQYGKDQTTESYEQNQAILDEQFELLGNIYTIKEEKIIGSNIFMPIKASIDTVDSVKSKTLSNDDTRSLFFQQAKYEHKIGKKYEFGDNVWITTNTKTINTLMNVSLVQRCNNVLKWYDKETNSIHEEPCVLGNKITSTTTEQQTHIQVIQGELSVILQYNDITKKIKINQRFVINGMAYEVRMVNATQRQKTNVVDSVGLIYLELDIATKNNATDNVVDNIAYVNNENNNDILYNGNIVTPDIHDLTCFAPYDIGEYEVYNYVNGVKQNDTFEFDFLDALTSKYTVLNVSGNSFKIKCLDFSQVPLVVSFKNLVSGEINEFKIILRGVL